MTDSAATRMVCVIGARAGSKRLPGKNKKDLAGRPLWTYPVQQAREAGIFDRILFSTDDDDILAGLADYPDVVPHRRSKEMATDGISFLDVMAYLIEAGYLDGADSLALLTPCHPLRQARHIREAYDLFLEKNADTLASITPYPCPPELAMDMDDGWVKRPWTGLARKNRFKPRYYPNGAIVMARTDFYRRHKDFYGDNTIGYVLPWPYCLDIDYPEDLALAEQLIALNGRV